MTVYNIRDYRSPAPLTIQSHPERVGGEYVDINISLHKDFADMLIRALSPFSNVLNHYQDNRTEEEKRRILEKLEREERWERETRERRIKLIAGIKKTYRTKHDYHEFIKATSHKPSRDREWYDAQTYFKDARERQDTYLAIKARNIIKLRSQGVKLKDAAASWGITSSAANQCVKVYTKKEAGKRYVARYQPPNSDYITKPSTG